MSLQCKQWKDWSTKHQEPVTKLSGFKSCLLVIISVLVTEGTSRKLWLPSLGESNLGHMRCHCCYRWQPCHQRCWPSSGRVIWFVITTAWGEFLSLRRMLIDWLSHSSLDSKFTLVCVPVGSLDQDIVKTHTKMPTGDGYKVKAAVPGFYPIFSCLGSPSVQSMLFSKSSF